MPPHMHFSHKILFSSSSPPIPHSLVPVLFSLIELTHNKEKKKKPKAPHFCPGGGIGKRDAFLEAREEEEGKNCKELQVVPSGLEAEKHGSGVEASAAATASEASSE